MWSNARLSGRLARVGALFFVIGIVGLAMSPPTKGSGAVVAFGAALLVPALWNAWRGAQVAREYSFGPPPAIPPALMQLLVFLDNSYRSGGDLDPGQVQQAAAGFGLGSIPHTRGNLDEVAAALGRGRKAVLFVNSKSLPGRRISRSWYPIVVLALARSRGRTVVQVADPLAGHLEQLDGKSLVAAWKADDRFAFWSNLFTSWSSNKPPTGPVPRMWLEI